MKKIKKPPGFGYFLVAISLLLLSALFLYLEHITHYEFLLHIAASPLEILVGGILVERYLARREKRRLARQLMFIKSYLFRSELRTLYMTNFGALAYPRIDMKDIKGASPKELKGWLKQVEEKARYLSPEAMEAVITEYVNAYLSFNRFLEWAINNDFERIFYDMIMLMHFIHDAQLFKSMHPNELFISKALKNPEQMERVKAVLTDGIKSFLRFCIELQEHEPDVFLILMEDYMIAFPIQPDSWKSKPGACIHDENA
jgi:hypothetical protein